MNVNKEAHIKTGHEYDAVVVGSGPNGMAAAITLAQEGKRVVVFEGRDTIGGGMRSAALTLPGFLHDICSAIHPLALGSPFFRQLPLADYGLEWIHPDIPLAHPFDDGRAAALHRSIAETGETLGADGPAYARLMHPLVADWQKVLSGILAPLRLPRHPLALARFGLLGVRSARGLAQARFRTEVAKGFFAGLAAHSVMPLEKPLTSSFGLTLGLLGHAVGWPLPRGGSQELAAALAAHLQALGGEIVTDHVVDSIAELPAAGAYLLDVTPRQMLRIAGDHFPAGYRKALQRFRYGPGVFKVDWALDGPIPWKSTLCRRAGTVHLGATLAEISDSEREMWRGCPPDRPYVLVVQQSLFDPTRAPEGKHTGWAYCHVPHNSTADMTEAIESQVERFAPGFRDLILSRHTYSAPEFEAYNPNYIGGAITGGIQDIRQLFTRPVARPNPYTTPDPSIFLCSASTPPGGGVHGMCGYFAAKSALPQLR